MFSSFWTVLALESKGNSGCNFLERKLLFQNKTRKRRKGKGKETLGILVIVNKRILERVNKLYYEKHIKYFSKVFSEGWSEDLRKELMIFIFN